MGRFGAVDGLLLLALQVALVGLGLLLGARLARRRPLPLRRVVLAGLLSYVLAFIAHVLVLRGLKAGAVEVYENLLVRRCLVAVAWALATALALHLLRRWGIPRQALALGAVLGAAAYLVFAFWRA
jgi:hypothetical protein